MQHIPQYNEKREAIAALWSSYLGIKVDADDVKNMMVLHGVSGGIKRREPVPLVEPPLVGKFWDFIESIVEDRDIDLSKTVDEYALHMASVKKAWLARGRSAAEFMEIKRLLILDGKRCSLVDKGRCVSHPYTGKAHRCWIFEKNKRV